jgi:uncharacterized hydrophobic protein (TIGR00271 family)
MPGVVQLRVIAVAEDTEQVLSLLGRAEGVVSVVVHRGAAVRPAGDVIICDVADEAATLIVGDLRTLGITRRGVVDVEQLEASVSTRGRTVDGQVAGRPADAVLWHAVGERIASQGFLSWGLLLLFGLSGMIAAIAVLLDSAPIVVGAMAVSPDFGPIAAFAVGVTRRRRDIALGGWAALVAGFTVAVIAAFLMIGALILTGVAPTTFTREGNTLAEVIAAPDAYSVVVAFLAGAAGMISVALNKSGALIGVAISITTIPAAADVGLSFAYGEWDAFLGSGLQLALNIIGLLVSSTLVLAVMRRYSVRRMVEHRRLLGLGPIPAGPPPEDDALSGPIHLDGSEVVVPATPSSPAPTTPRSSS